MANELLLAGFGLAITLAVCLGVFFGSKRIISKSRLSQTLQFVILSILRGPVIVTIAGYGLLLSVEPLINFQSIAVPSFISPAGLNLLLQLVILAVSIRTLGSIVKTVTPMLTKEKEVDQILVYSVYALGFVVLAYILLTSSTISAEINANIWAVINFLTGIFATYLAVYVVNVIFKRYSAAIESKEASLRTTLTFVRRLVLGIVALIGVAAATFASFPTVGGVIASLFVAAGFASIVIGLASQASLSNLIAGMVISTSQPFRVGDALSYANEWAIVEDIRLTFTVLRTWDNRRLVVPNQMFLNSTMINYNAVDSSKLCIVYVAITYESDMDKAIEILKDTAKKHPDFLPAGNLPVVHLMDIGDANGSYPDANAASGILLRLLSRAKDQPTNFQMSKDILYQVKKAFDAVGIELAYPRRQIVIDSQPREFSRKRPVDAQITKPSNSDEGPIEPDKK